MPIIFAQAIASIPATIGMFVPSAQTEGSGWNTFLKVFDSKEKEWDALSDDYTYIIPDGLRWSDWAEDDEGIIEDRYLPVEYAIYFKQKHEYELKMKEERKKKDQELFSKVLGLLGL